MENAKERWRVHEEQLRKLGFSNKLIDEAVQSEALGLFDMVPSGDLVERTVERCAHLYRELAVEASASTNTATAFVDAPAMPTDLSHLAECVGSRAKAARLELTQLSRLFENIEGAEALSTFGVMEGLPLACMSSVEYALGERKRPFVFLENHNLVDPAWWQTDAAFRSMRVACKTVNSIVTSKGIPAAAAVVVLRPKISDYSKHDIEVLSDLVRSSTFDIWWVSYRHAGEYRDKGVMVVGDDHVFTLNEKAEDTWHVFSATVEKVDHSLATMHRERIESLATHAARVRIGESLSSGMAKAINKPDRLKGFLQDVITKDVSTVKAFTTTAE